MDSISKPFDCLIRTLDNRTPLFHIMRWDFYYRQKVNKCY